MQLTHADIRKAADNVIAFYNDENGTKWHYNDGGRAAAGFKGETRDCVTRAIAIATGLPYKEVYTLVNDMSKTKILTSSKPIKSSARTGVHKDVTRWVMEYLGWKWVPTMQVGKGCTVHLKASELPPGRLVVKVSRHAVAVIDGIIQDTYDCSRGGTRCVYGYFVQA